LAAGVLQDSASFSSRGRLKKSAEAAKAFWMSEEGMGRFDRYMKPAVWKPVRIWRAASRRALGEPWRNCEKSMSCEALLVRLQMRNRKMRRTGIWRFDESTAKACGAILVACSVVLLSILSLISFCV
jgi:hypothetical protein